MALRFFRNSRKIRQALSDGNGLKTIEFTPPVLKGNEQGGLLGRISGFFGRVVGFLGRALSGLANWLMRGAGAILRGLVSALDFLANFDWQASDDEIKQAIQARNDATLSLVGGLAGRGLGWGASILLGAGVSMVVPVIGGRALATSILQSSGSEALEELWGETKATLRGIGFLQGSNAAARAYMAGRAFIKRLPQGALESVLGERGARFVKQSWGAKGADSWTIASWRDRRIEKIRSNGWRGFWESLVEEGWDALSEGTFIVSADIDDAVNSHLAAQSTAPDRAIEIQPDREAPDESIRVYGTPREVTSIVHGAMATAQLLGNRDVGYVGNVEGEGLWTPEHQRRRLTLFYYSVPKPPWTQASADFRSIRAIKRQVAIPNPRRNISWQEVKTAMGGAGGFDSGVAHATARLSSRRKMTVKGATEDLAVQRLEALAALSEDTILNINVGETRKFASRDVPLRLRRIRVYPALAYTVSLTLTTEEEGRLVSEGLSYVQSEDKIEMWRDEAPENVQFFR
ncbi:MAG: hypothetical protein ACFB9N_05130 [Geitlerinemataceae cyanobacterium]